MSKIINAPRGTADVLPEQSYKWQYVENILREIAKSYGYSETRFPTFEYTELFQRGVGDATDIVQKEMYTFLDKGGRSITLRPEGTASAARLVLENSLYAGALPLKMYYIISGFRYEKPQAGRLREFHQFGVEVFGADKPCADAEVISLGNNIFKRFNIKGIKLLLNTIGCPICRKEYTKKLTAYFSKQNETLCDTCKDRLERNPMRLFDCKSPVCQSVTKDAPIISDYLCDKCKTHFEQVKQYLDAMKIKYEVAPRLVRGLDYYTKTVFEFVSDNIGAQGTVLAGGRYDGLIEELGGPQLSGLGFAMGLERLLLLLEKSDTQIPKPQNCAVYIVNIGEDASVKALSVVNELRGKGIFAQCDISGRSLNKQMIYANKIGATYTMVLGDNELSSGKANIKDMKTGEQKEIEIDEIDKWFINIKS